MADIAVLGAGVLGLTVAISARLLGNEVTIYSQKRISDANAQQDPLFASAYPAASIIPHSVGKASLELVRASDSIFEQLGQVSGAGVRLQRHFELSESGVKKPDYASALRAFKEHVGDAPIQREGGALASGFSFDCYFCNMPVYGPWLETFSRTIGVVHERREVDRTWLAGLSADLVVNCLGVGASKVYEDIAPGLVLRGLLLLCPYAQPDRPIASYNYTPDFSAYPGFGGQAADVYFYPRVGHCILGGTRQQGRIDPVSGAFVAEEPLRAELIDVCGEPTPRPIVDLNRELVAQLTGVQLGGPNKVLVGFRHQDTETATGEGKLTIEPRDRPSLAPHIDCLGFGGAGVTLSWGAAATVICKAKAILGDGGCESTVEAATREIRAALMANVSKN